MSNHITSCSVAVPYCTSRYGISPAVGSDGRVYIGSFDSKLYAFGDPQPTQKPTSQPSTQPSSQPSSRPSSTPSSRPAASPSGRPSSSPTCIAGEIYTETLSAAELSSLGTVAAMGSGLESGVKGKTPTLLHRCSVCVAGSYAPYMGSSYCVVCPRGTYLKSAVHAVQHHHHSGDISIPPFAQALSSISLSSSSSSTSSFDTPCTTCVYPTTTLREGSVECNGLCLCLEPSSLAALFFFYSAVFGSVMLYILYNSNESSARKMYPLILLFPMVECVSDVLYMATERFSIPLVAVMFFFALVDMALYFIYFLARTKRNTKGGVGVEGQEWSDKEKRLEKGEKNKKEGVEGVVVVKRWGGAMVEPLRLFSQVHQLIDGPPIIVFLPS